MNSVTPSGHIAPPPIKAGLYLQWTVPSAPDPFPVLKSNCVASLTPGLGTELGPARVFVSSSIRFIPSLPSPPSSPPPASLPLTLLQEVEMDTGVDLDAFISVMWGSMATNYCSIASVAVLAWDWATHITEEIEYIWQKDWRMAGKPLYLFLRYGGIAFQIYDFVQMVGIWDKQFCAIYFIVNPIITPIFLFVVDIVLAYRTMCLFRMNRTLLIANIILYSICIIATITIAGYSFSQFSVIATPPYLNGCWTMMPDTISMTGFPLLSFELWLFFLVLLKVFRYVKEYGKISKESILQLLVKDSTSWFFIMALFIIWNIFQMAMGPEGTRALALPSFIVICGCRLVIHIRQQMYRSQVYATTMTPINFNYSATNPATPRTPGFRRPEYGSINSIAEKIGLPPASKRLESMWPDTESSIATTSDEISMTTSPVIDEEAAIPELRSAPPPEQSGTKEEESKSQTST
ncbi:hypothetical protein FRB99_003743 [Tulasnella sp. 403]|nr:hypothetical protein FRB99_003743 [Tulasnella sp. 403]